jgi:hypothetical protein
VADDETISYENDYYEDCQDVVKSTVGELNASGRTNADYLEDLEYLFAMIQENFPLFNATYRRHGIDFNELYENTRAFIEHRNITNDQGFMHILETHFFEPIIHIGHLSIMHPYEYHMNMEFIESNHQIAYDSFGSFQYETLNNPATIEFYSAFSISEDFRPNNLSTDIIEDNNIAYIRLYWMVNMFMDIGIWMESRQTLYDFYYEIQDFQHLIVDLRGNGGGCRDFFPHLIMGPNITEMLTAYFYWFANGNTRTFQWQEHNFDIRNLSLEPISSEFIASMPYLHEDDVEWLDYYILYELRIRPISWSGEFNGMVWLLIDEWTGSAADSATLMSKQTGFATIVGQPTMGGGASISPVFFPLPNTGMLIRYVPIYTTDIYGRNNYEYGTAPHIFNRPGLDAMETVLELIREGEY